MNYIYFLLNGNREEKVKFIFEMIALKKSEFDYEDLVKFYIIVNRDEDTIQSFLSEEDDFEEREMANIVFTMMH